MTTRTQSVPIWPVWIFSLVLLLLFRHQVSGALIGGIEQCTQVLIPSLFPFFIVSNLLLATDFPEKLARLLRHPMEKTFHLNPNGSAAVVIGFLGGYPIGAKTAAQLYQHGKLTLYDTKQLLCLCNNTGPAIFFGLIGGALFPDFLTPLVCYLIHIASALLTAFLLRPQNPPQRLQAGLEPAQSSTSLPQAVTAAFQSTGFICAFVLAFSILIGILQTLLSVCFPAISERSVPFCILTGLLDLPNAIQSLTALSNPRLQFILANAFVNWGGLCIHLQTRAVLQDMPVLLRNHRRAKLLQCILATLLSSALVCFRSGQILPILLLFFLLLVIFVGKNKFSCSKTVKKALY